MIYRTLRPLNSEVAEKIFENSEIGWKLMDSIHEHSARKKANSKKSPIIEIEDINFGSIKVERL